MKNKDIENLMNMLRNKYPETSYEGLVKLVFYSDNSGAIREGGNNLFEFESIADLIEHLRE